MPRASDYLLEGYTYHLTHRCQKREFHLQFRSERDRYREWLREGVFRFGVPVYAYCITSNHVHIVVHADDPEAVSRMMHLAAGSTAKHYNLRKGHLGPVWEHPYHCTIVEDGQHLLNCLRYIDMNMVRAGRVSHPREWRWCGYDELVGSRKRYRILNLDRLMQSLSYPGRSEDLAHVHEAAIEEQVRTEDSVREPQWTEALAVGSADFVENLTTRYRNRYDLKVDSGKDEAWTVREAESAYTTDFNSKSAL